MEGLSLADLKIKKQDCRRVKVRVFALEIAALSDE